MSRPKMYKARFTRWGLNKNNKEDEIMAILSKRMERAAVGKDTAFELRGRLVDMAKVARYERRKPITSRDIMAWRAAGARTPPGLRCFTPLPVIQPLGLPEIFDAPAKLFGNVCIYSTRSFYDGIWVSK